MIVDDNPLNMKLVNVLLAGEGYRVRTAADTEEALAVLEECHPQMILMDIQLPGIDGLELTPRLKADPSTRDITILGLTAYAMKGDEERMLRWLRRLHSKTHRHPSLPALIKSFLNREMITTVPN